MSKRFRDRTDAGRRLAPRLSEWSDRGDVIVLALPRGGAPVAAEVARHLHAPLDVFLVRKLGVPGHEELAMGAIASGGIVVWNDGIVANLRLSPTRLDETIARERRELERRERVFRRGQPPHDLAGKAVILVDDGLATGSTMRAAIDAARQQQPRRLIVAVPVGAPDVCSAMARLADEVVCLITPRSFRAVGQWYDDFSEVSDDDVRSILTAECKGEEIDAREASRSERTMSDGIAGRRTRSGIRRDDVAPLMEAAEDRAPDGDMPPDAVVSNAGIDPELLSEAAAGTGDDDDDIPEHMWPAEGVDSLGEYSRRAAESPEEVIDRMPDDDEPRDRGR